MNILLYIQDEETLSNVSEELLNITSFWKKQKSGNLYVILYKKLNNLLKEEIKKWPVDKIFFLEKEEVSTFKNISAVFSEILNKEKIDCIVMGNNIFQRELAPYLAAKLDWEFIPNIIDFEFKDNILIWKRFLYGTRAIEESKTENKNFIVTVSGNIYKKDEREKNDNIKSENIQIHFNDLSAYILKLSEKKKIKKHSLETAKIVIGVGKGIQSKENFSMVEDLADLMGATIGVTRSVVDNGWRPEYEKIGQTGKIIKPELYLGFGISGAMQHMAGVQQARHIIMVNNNPNAESFRSSDFGIVADLFEVIPKLISILKDRK